MNKNNKYARFFLAPDDESGGGGAPASATQDPWHHNGEEDGGDAEGDTNIRQAPVVEPEGGAKPVTPAPVTIDPKAFEAFGSSFAKTFTETQRANTPPAPPTPEQIAQARKELFFPEIDDNFIRDFGNVETQKASFEKFRDSLIKHVITVVNHLRTNDKAEFDTRFTEKFTPLESLLAERTATENQAEFGRKYPQFSSPDHAPDVEAAIGYLREKGAFEGKDKAACFKVLAETLAGAAKRYNPNFVLEEASASSSQPSRQGNAIPVTSGGSGGSRSGNGATAKKNWALNHIK